jgi:hypothetical protein
VPKGLLSVLIFFALAALLTYLGTPLWATIFVEVAALVIALPFVRRSR